MFDLSTLIRAVGIFGIGAIVFAESGLLIGVFLPGDSLLFTAGFLASQGVLAIVPLIIVSFSAAVLGDNVGYWLGKRFGPAVFSRKDSLLLDESHIDRARKFYATHGPGAIVLARFVPLMRTLAPILAGVGSMPWPTFAAYNIVGGLIWGVGMPLAGYWLGSSIPGVDQYLLPIVALIVCISLAPGLYHFLRDRENRKLLVRRLRTLFE